MPPTSASDAQPATGAAPSLADRPRSAADINPRAAIAAANKMAEFEERVNPALRQAINEAYKEAIHAGAKGQTDPLTTIAKSLLAAAGKDGNGAAALSSGEPKQAWVEGSVEPTQRPSPAKASGGEGAEMQDLLARVSDEVHR